MNNTKKCSKCQEEKCLNDFYYYKNRKHYTSSCKNCNKKESHSYQIKQRKDQNIKYVCMMRSAEIRRKCKDKNISFDSDIRNILINQWEKQKGLCFYSGRQMSISGDYHTNLDAMTIDKVNPSLGYVEGNIVMCCRIFNSMKQNLTYDEFMNHCKEVLEYNKI
jgi:hypothetical protein